MKLEIVSIQKGELSMENINNKKHKKRKEKT